MLNNVCVVSVYILCVLFEGVMAISWSEPGCVDVSLQLQFTHSSTLTSNVSLVPVQTCSSAELHFST